EFEGKLAAGRADISSLGCVLYECLTGKVPFQRDQEAAVMYAHLKERPPRVTDVVPELSSGLDRVVGKAMAKRPEDRFQTGRPFAEALRAEVAPLVREQQPRSRIRIPRSPQRRVVIGAAAVA